MEHFSWIIYRCTENIICRLNDMKLIYKVSHMKNTNSANKFNHLSTLLASQLIVDLVHNHHMIIIK